MKNRILNKSLVILAAFILSLGVGTGLASARVMMEGGGGGGGGEPFRRLSHTSTINGAYGSGDVFDMQLVGNSLYLANYLGDPVFDISNPYAPFKKYEIVHEYVWDYAHHAIKVANNKYYAASDKLNVWDISGPAPIFLGGSGTGGSSADWNAVDVSGNYAYTTYDLGGPMSGQQERVESWDVSNPQAIRQLSSYILAQGYFDDGPQRSNPHSLIAEGSTLYMGMEGFRVFDVSNPSSITPQGRVDARGYNSSADDMKKEGALIYKAHKPLGVLVINVGGYVSGNQYPVLEGIIGPPTIPVDGHIALDVVGHKAFVATVKDKQIRVLDVTDVRNPVVLASRDISDVFSGTEENELEIKVDATRKLLVVAGNAYFNIYDVSAYLP